MMQQLTINGRSALVAFRQSFTGPLVDAADASVAIAAFDDGTMGYYTLATPRAAGGPGSGNFGHAGRPGEVGGSADSTGDRWSKEQWAKYHATPESERTPELERARQRAFEVEYRDYIAAKPPVTVFHGTSSEAITSIKEEGIKPAAGQGADAHALEIGLGDPNATMRFQESVIAERKASVFVTHDQEIALRYAKYAAKATGGSPVVLSLSIPSSVFQAFKSDEASEVHHQALRFPGVIKPEWIDGTVNSFGELETLEAANRFYLVFVTEEARDLGGPGSGHHGHAGRPGQVGGSSDDGPRSEKSRRALKAFKPIHAINQRYAEKNELKVRRMVDGTRTDDNKPVDVITKDGKHGIEVKTMINNDNNKITVRAAALAKKEAWARENKARLHTVLIDDRDKFKHPRYSGHKIYYMRGTGSFRLSSMVPVESAAHLRRLMK